MISDSIGKRVHTIKDCELFVRRGKTFSGIADCIINNMVVVRDRRAILIHVGTNDVSDMLRRQQERNRQLNYMGRAQKPPITVEQIVEGFKSVVHQIRRQNRAAKILFSAILPRPTDYNDSEPIIRQVNSQIEAYCWQHDFIFVYSYKWFCRAGLPVKSYFAQNDDLHLSDAGSSRLEQAFQMALSDSNLLRPVKRKGEGKKQCSKKTKRCLVQLV